VLFLRKQLLRSRIDALGLVNDDRVVALALSRPAGPMKLIYELTGASTNLLLLDGDDTIRAVLRERSADEGRGRLLVPGARYRPPDKVAPARSTGKHTELPAPDGGSPAPMNRAAERLFTRVLEEQRTEVMRRELRAACQRTLVRTERLIAALSGDLARSERSEEYQRAGSLILANLRDLAKGQAHAALWDPDGRTVEVVLDPTRSPTENAEAYFRRSKKAKASRMPLQDRLDDAHEEADLLRLAQEEIALAPDEAALGSIRARLLRYGLIRASGARSREQTGNHPSIRTVRFEGWDILIGKSAASNDHISRVLARPDDLWLHAEGLPGSHVLVRNPGRQAVPPAVLKRAAELAAYFSKGKGASKVPVAYTEAKHVSKPKGARPGMVVLARRRSIMVAPVPL
jgi:predicted ribosome quality control (RQC) complex YloA/Tae2 family protein